MNKRMAVTCFTILTLTILLSPSQVTAAEEKKSQWTITPRTWQSKYEDVSAYIPGQTYLIKTNTMDIDFYGLTVRYSPDWTNKFDFIFTGYTGDGDTEMTQIDNLGTITVTTIDVGREDIEFLARHHLWERSRAYLLYGYRWMHLDESFVIGPVNFSGEYEYNYLELGYGFSASVNETGSINAFANFILGFGNFEHELTNGVVTIIDKEQQASMLDINMGMQWVATDNLSFNARYRSVRIGYDFDFNDSDRVTFIHGLEIGGSVSF